ncbi:hypothetical protein FACS189447_07920 [Spirochaetia bacterium]|nr:hypothetical protein FACS189447_07920 [Spirochaetia bacterium]
MSEEETGADISAAAANSKDKIDAATAENEFIIYCENNGIEYEEAGMNDDEKESFADIKKRFIKHCKQGRVEVDGTTLKYVVSKLSPDGIAGETIKITRPSGAAFVGMDTFKDRESVHKLHGFMSAMTGKEVKYFSKLDISDWKFFQAVASLFLSL